MYEIQMPIPSLPTICIRHMNIQALYEFNAAVFPTWSDGVLVFDFAASKKMNKTKMMKNITESIYPFRFSISELSSHTDLTEISPILVM